MMKQFRLYIAERLMGFVLTIIPDSLERKEILEFYVGYCKRRLGIV